MLGKPVFLGNSSYDHETTPRTVVLLVNVGTPEAPTPRAVRRYLAEFLNDPRIIEMPRWLWWLILHGVILRVRPARSARAYTKIWTPQGSPLLVHSQALSQQLSSSLTEVCPGPLRVYLAMRYGQPSISQALNQLRQENVQRLLVLPLYPQYCAATTASTFDAVTDTLKSWRWVPEVRFINGYHDVPGYISALAQSIECHWNTYGCGEHLLLSFHGIPERYFRAGDPYFCFCQKTARLLAEHLSLTPEQYSVSFQSRVGMEDWLRPYTVDHIEQLAKQGVRRLQVICPGFAVDCLETLEEIAMDGREHFLAAGGESFAYIPALNATTAHVDMLTKLVLRHGQGWPEFDSAWSAEEAATKAILAKQLSERMHYDA